MTIHIFVLSMRLSSFLAAQINADCAATGGPCTLSAQKLAVSMTCFASLASAPGAFSTLTRAWSGCPVIIVFAVDGIHPNFDVVATMASHLLRTLLRNIAQRQSTWLQHAGSATSQHFQVQAPAPPQPTAAALAAAVPSSRPQFSHVVRG
ncbi:hypothetical protein HPB48_020889 [Haemaphysalis longicornis]|uniref:Secreted protein n=1 Tax=Haemaphysalis longicornis TaxID=44386 RepID=A0A9J6GL46_HAELO|nr:hypothetical protein HPB48_020889 [Haemaphysalis longicornis]